MFINKKTRLYNEIINTSLVIPLNVSMNAMKSKALMMNQMIIDTMYITEKNQFNIYFFLNLSSAML